MIDGVIPCQFKLEKSVSRSHFQSVAAYKSKNNIRSFLTHSWIDLMIFIVNIWRSKLIHFQYYAGHACNIQDRILCCSSECAEQSLKVVFILVKLLITESCSKFRIWQKPWFWPDSLPFKKPNFWNCRRRQLQTSHNHYWIRPGHVYCKYEMVEHNV